MSPSSAPSAPPAPSPEAALAAKTAADLGWPSLLAELAARCHTERGAAAALALTAFDTVAAARERLAEVGEARQLWSIDAPMPFGGIQDVDAQVARADKGGDLDASELLAVGQALAGCARLRRHLAGQGETAPRLATRAMVIDELSHVHGPILDSIDDSGRIHDHASPSLGGLRRRVAELSEQLARRARTLVDDPNVAQLLSDRFYTQREERYVLPVRADARGRVKGIVHGASQSGQTVFVEPEELVDLNNRLKLAETEVADEERRILAELSGYVREAAGSARASLAVAAHLDLVDGAARLADALDATLPELGDGGALHLPVVRHPLMVLSPRACVPSTIDLPPAGCLVISGPNAGGKTVALKSTGLAALMARAGLHVAAAPGARLPFYARVLTDIGDEQSLERNLSSFSAHLTNVRGFLAVADASTLVLLDEMAVGTEPEQGAALATAVLEALAAAGAQVIVTTHYERLKALAGLDPRFLNASVGFDLSRLAPTFELHTGVPGSSAALLLARRMGLPGEVVQRAEVLLGDQRAGLEALMVALAEERRLLETTRRAAEAERREAGAARREAEGLARDAERRVRELRKGAHDEVVAELRKVRDELGRARKLAQRAAREVPSLDEARQVVDAAAARAQSLAPAPAPVPGKPASAAQLAPGVRVYIASLGGRGEVVSPPERGRVLVQMGSMRTLVAVDELRLDDGPPAAPPPPALRTPPGTKRRTKDDPGAARARQALAGLSPAAQAEHGGGGGAAAGADGDDDALAPARTPDATLDLRGERVDDGVARLDQFLDDALIAEREVVFVIHGHGTGAMKQAVRAHLARHRAVDKSRAGRAREGGDGITVIWLK